MKKIKLNNNLKIPSIGFGTWQISSKEAKQKILEAYKNGYRHFDTAQIYNNEYEIGLALKSIPRHKIFLTTKIWLPNYTSEKIFLTSVKQSLKRLNVKYVDLLLLHWPHKEKNILAYKSLEKAQELGYTKSIGVSNFMIHHLEEILKIAKHKPVINQIEFQPLVQQKQLIKFCKSHNIKIIGYSNLKSYLNNQMSIKSTDTLKQIALEVQKTVPEVILRWVYQQGIIIIPKSMNIERMQQNFSITNFKLNQNQMKLISKIDLNNYTKSDDIYNGKLWAEEILKLSDFLFDNHF